MPPKHSWEGDNSASDESSGKHSWERDDEPALSSDEEGGGPEWGDHEDDQEASDEEDERQAAERDFLELLGELWCFSKISAEHYCTLCFFAARGGMSAKVRQHGMPPNRHTGHYNRKCKKLFQMEPASTAQYMLEMPGHDKNSLSRTKFEVAVVPPHEIVDRAVAKHPDIMEELQLKHDLGLLPPNYYSNALVKKSSAPLLPLSLYMDAAPYSLTDSCLGVWVEELATGRRFVVAIIRKRRVCKCGCRGWCSYWVLMNWLRTCFVALGEGKWPMQRHDCKKWAHQDRLREAKAGSELSTRGVLVQLRGDWAEFCERLGLPTWQSSMRSCFVCSATHDKLFEFSTCTPISGPWHVNDHSDYENSCASCEHKVLVDAGAIRDICRVLRYDKRDSRHRGNLGRCLTQDLPKFGLLAGDRLEPSANLQDVADLSELCQLPGESVELTFWRRSDESLCMHRCPIYDVSMGITCPQVVVFDVLHTLHLGVMQSWVKCVLWKLIKAGVWRGLGGDDGFQNSVAALRHELFAWYRSYKEEELTRVADLVPSMLGKETSGTLKTKGAETYGLLVFCLVALRRYGEALPGAAAQLLAAGQSLKQWVDALKNSPVVVSVKTMQEACRSQTRSI